MYFAKQKGSLSCAAISDLIRCIGDQKLTKRDCNDTKHKQLAIVIGHYSLRNMNLAAGKLAEVATLGIC